MTYLHIYIGYTLYLEPRAIFDFFSIFFRNEVLSTRPRIYIKNTPEAAAVFTTTMLCQADADELCMLLHAKAIVDHTRHTLSKKPTEKCMEMDTIF